MTLVADMTRDTINTLSCLHIFLISSTSSRYLFNFSPFNFATTPYATVTSPPPATAAASALATPPLDVPLALPHVTVILPTVIVTRAIPVTRTLSLSFMLLLWIPFPLQ